MRPLIRASDRRWGQACTVVLALAAGWPGGASATAGAAVGRPPYAQSAPSAEVRLAPVPVEADDGNHYLLYELHLRGLGRRSVTAIDVLDLGAAGNGDPRASGGEPRVLASYRGEHLRRMVFDFIIDYDRRFYYDAMGRAASFHLGGGGERMAYLTLGAVEVDRAASMIDPPVQGGSWLARGTVAEEPPPHRLSLVRHRGEVGIHDRYAIDFTRIGEGGRDRRGRGAANEEFLAWGAGVLAVAEGVVVQAVDGLPDNEGSAGVRAMEITKETLGGNHVILDIGTARFAVYAHLQRGSVAVSPGDRVRASAVLGRVGNSGNSNEPHLHFALVSEPSVISGEGLPFVFERFRTQGACEIARDRWECVADSGTEQHARIPRSGRLVSFP